MTEDEAKTKRCPLIAGIRIEQGVVKIGGATCVGSECMMWRCHKRKVGYCNEVLIEENIEGTGYCGLAGRP